MAIAMDMESQASWQVVSNESSEFVSSPGLRSPSLYQTGDDDFVFEQKRPTSLKRLGTRAEFAAKLLQDLEGRSSFKFETENDFGEIWNEESHSSLDLFRELSEVSLRYTPTPPATPNSEEFENQHDLAEFSDSDPSLMTFDSSEEFPEEAYNELTAELAEFHDILELLPTSGIEGLGIDLGEVVQICGIPMVELEMEQAIKEEEANTEGQGQSDDDSNDMDASDEEDEGEVICAFTESELAECGVGSSQMIENSVLDLSYKEESCSSEDSSDQSDEDFDVESTVSEEMLSMIRGKRFTQSEAFTGKTQNLPTTSRNVFSMRKEEKQQEKKKPIKRVRDTRGKRKKAKSDNNARVKLQNRTAAARYRMKKKLEALQIKEEEDQIEKENLSLQAEYEDLKRQITLVKQLVRDVFKSKRTQIRTTKAPTRVIKS